MLDVEGVGKAKCHKIKLVRRIFLNVQALRAWWYGSIIQDWTLLVGMRHMVLQG